MGHIFEVFSSESGRQMSSRCLMIVSKYFLSIQLVDFDIKAPIKGIAVTIYRLQAIKPCGYFLATPKVCTYFLHLCIVKG